MTCPSSELPRLYGLLGVRKLWSTGQCWPGSSCHVARRSCGVQCTGTCHTSQHIGNMCQAFPLRLGGTSLYIARCSLHLIHLTWLPVWQFCTEHLVSPKFGHQCCIPLVKTGVRVEHWKPAVKTPSLTLSCSHIGLLCAIFSLAHPLQAWVLGVEHIAVPAAGLLVTLPLVVDTLCRSSLGFP